MTQTVTALTRAGMPPCPRIPCYHKRSSRPAPPQGAVLPQQVLQEGIRHGSLGIPAAANSTSSASSLSSPMTSPFLSETPSHSNLTHKSSTVSPSFSKTPTPSGWTLTLDALPLPSSSVLSVLSMISSSWPRSVIDSFVYSDESSEQRRPTDVSSSAASSSISSSVSSSSSSASWSSSPHPSSSISSTPTTSASSSSLQPLSSASSPSSLSQSSSHSFSSSLSLPSSLSSTTTSSSSSTSASWILPSLHTAITPFPSSSSTSPSSTILSLSSVSSSRPASSSPSTLSPSVYEISSLQLQQSRHLNCSLPQLYWDSTRRVMCSHLRHKSHPRTISRPRTNTTSPSPRSRPILRVLLTFILVALSLLGSSGAAALDQNSTDLESSKRIAQPTDQLHRSEELTAPTSHGNSQMGPEGNVTCVGEDHSGIRLASFRWREVGVYYTITAFVIIAGLAKLGFHHLRFISSKVPESCVLIILGVALGFLIFFTSHDGGPTAACHYYVQLPHFTSDRFFLILLPPIILESAYSLHDRAFFDNLGTVLVFAFFGTIFNVFAIGPTLYGIAKANAMGPINFTFTESLVFASLISAVDPVAVLAIFQDLGVNKDLYFLVFGESLLNDGVTVVLYNTMTAFAKMQHVTADQYALSVAAFAIVTLGGIVIGIFFGCLTALLTKCTADVRVVEPLAMLGLAYLSYLSAELFHFSGIISLIVCGLVQAHYACQNISQKSYTTVKYFTKMASATSDTIIFMFLGMVLVSDQHKWHTGFVLWTVFLCLIFRFVAVALLSAIMNNYRVKKIGFEEQFIIAYGGLRGAVAFSLVNMLDENMGHRRVFVTTTLIVILFTVFVQGITIRPLVDLLNIKKREKGRKSLNEEINDTAMDHVMAGIEEVLGHRGDFYLREMLEHYNDKYLNKWFLRQTCESNLKRLFEKIAISEHYAHLYGPVAMIEDKVKPLVNTNKPDPIANALPNSQREEILLQPRLSFSWDKQDIKKARDYRTGSIQVRPKHRTSYIPVRRARVASESRVEMGELPHTVPDDTRALRLAFKENPYNKLHYKYNRNLVDEEDQELEEHLQRRHLNARRMSRLASFSPSTNSTTLTVPNMPRPVTDMNIGLAAVENLVLRHNRRSLRANQRRHTHQPLVPFASAPMTTSTVTSIVEEANGTTTETSGRETTGDEASLVAKGADILSSQELPKSSASDTSSVVSSPQSPRAYSAVQQGIRKKLKMPFSAPAATRASAHPKSDGKPGDAKGKDNEGIDEGIDEVDGSRPKTEGETGGDDMVVPLIVQPCAEKDNEPEDDERNDTPL